MLEVSIAPRFTNTTVKTSISIARFVIRLPSLMWIYYKKSLLILDRVKILIYKQLSSYLLIAFVFLAKYVYF